MHTERSFISIIHTVKMIRKIFLLLATCDAEIGFYKEILKWSLKNFHLKLKKTSGFSGFYRELWHAPSKDSQKRMPNKGSSNYF